MAGNVVSYDAPSTEQIAQRVGLPVAELSQLASGHNPFPKPLFEPISTGFWISIRNDNVVSLDQQYHP